MFETKLVEKIKTHFFIFNKCFRKLSRVRSNVEKSGISRHNADGNKGREL